jgi:hypothetical protein
MDIEIHYRDFSDLCGTDLKRIHVRQDGVYLEEIPESVAHFLSLEEIETLSFKKARDAFSHSDWNKPILFFPMTMVQFNLLTELAGFAGSIDQKRLSDFIADQDESNKYLQRHAQAMAGDRIDDRIYRGLLIPTIEDRNLDELIAEASEIVNELDGSGDSSTGNVQVGGVALCEEALCLLERLQDVDSSKSKNDLEKSMAYLEDAAVQLVFRIFDRETKGFPYANDKVRNLMEIFMSGRPKGSLDGLGNKVMAILHEYIQAQQGNKRRFPTWRQVVKRLEKGSRRCGKVDSCIYEVEWEDRDQDSGIIAVAGKDEPVTFRSLRVRLTRYKKDLKQEYLSNNIVIT